MHRCLETGFAVGITLGARAQESGAIGIFRGVGIVTEIDSSKTALTVDHEEIRGLMPAMVMMYRVDPPSLLGGLKPGDKIEFLIDVKRYTITEVKLLSR
jgi:Cu/Ag efflux protein CusF